jgi:DNA replication and repair protein RecF
MRLRQQAIDRLEPGAAEEYRHLAGYELACRYAPNVTGEPIEERFASRLEERRDDELVRRTTLVGPHRDELELEVRELVARAFASHGEAWAAALCLRLGLATAVAEEVDDPPVVLLDDHFSALDPRRQRQVANRLVGRGQVFVSVADDAYVPETSLRVWDVNAGSLRER